MTPAEFMRRYAQASAAHDLDATMRLIDEDAVYFFSNETCHIGRIAVEAAIKSNFDTIEMEKFEMRDVECILETEEAAVCLYNFHWSGRIDGLARAGSGRGTSVLRRDGASWRVVHEHLSHGEFRS